MKFIIFMLFPFFIYAQPDYPDTLFMKQSRSFPCFITALNNSSVAIIYADNRHETAVLESVSIIVLEKHGVIFTSEKGIVVDLNIITPFLEKRNEAERKRTEAVEKEKQEKLNAKLVNQQNQTKENINNNLNPPGIKPYLKWSFGILYIPYYSGKIYDIITSSDNSYPPTLFASSSNETNMEGQFSYGISANTRFTLDIGYSSGFTENRDETHVRYSDPNQNNNTDYGSLESKDLKLFNMTLGVKYYFTNVILESVSVYISGGIGKQFAFASTKYETLFPQPNQQIISQDNEDEYLKDLNSPWHFNVGFGAEYFFNKSLSLFSSIRFYYSKIHAKYESRLISASYQTQSHSLEYSNSDVITRIGLGLNFYF